MSNGLAIDKDNFTVLLIGSDLIKDILDKNDASSTEYQNEIACAVVRLYGTSYGVALTDENSVKWQLGATTEEDAALIASYLKDPHEIGVYKTQQDIILT